MKYKIFLIALLMSNIAKPQEVLTPETLWSLGRLSPLGISKDSKDILFKVSTPNISENKSDSKTFKVAINGSGLTEVKDAKPFLTDKLQKNGFELMHKSVKINKVDGKDFYNDLQKSDVQIYEALDYRHWDTWHDGTFNHLGYQKIGDETSFIDIMKEEPFNSPQKPFGGSEDYLWSPDGKKIIYVSKKKTGTASATSTNTDLFEYDLESKTTINLTEKNLGYDTHPDFSPDGYLTWLQMKRDGYEADKNDIIVRFRGLDMNLTAQWDGTVDDYKWSPDGKKIYFLAPVGGTKQLFEVNFPGLTRIAIQVNQLTSGVWDVNDLIGFSGNLVFVTRTTMNQAKDIFSYDLSKKVWKQLTNINQDIYSKLSLPTIQKRLVKTTDQKDMVVWVVLPPNFDASKKYPTLLYCQGGPQGALSQSYSYRWNFSLMASQGYIVVAPNRRGMPGHGVAWNEDISKDWGGQVIDDYLSAIDDVAKEPYVDKTRLGAVGASYGGYSVFYLAGIHQNRFKSFISHCGVFNLESMYGTTEEVFFTNWDIGGPYWDKTNAAAQKSYAKFNPIKLVDQWNTPILIIQGGKDYRVPIGQGQEAFQAAQLKGLKSKFVYFPDENHWVLKPQNALVWQREFFGWLKETL